MCWPQRSTGAKGPLRWTWTGRCGPTGLPHTDRIPARLWGEQCRSAPVWKTASWNWNCIQIICRNEFVNCRLPLSFPTAVTFMSAHASSSTNLNYWSKCMINSTCLKGKCPCKVISPSHCRSDSASWHHFNTRVTASEQKLHTANKHPCKCRIISAVPSGFKV